jgi:hypothetical protein
MRRVIAVAVVVGVYCVSYALLSLYGGYRLIMFGRPNPPGLGNSDFVWQPRFGECYQWGSGYAMDALGFLYFPLIRFDQSFMHPSRPYLTFVGADIDQPRVHGWPPVEQMHPTARRTIAVVDAVRERHQAAIDAARERKDFAEVARIKKQMQEEAQKELGVQP